MVSDAVTDQPDIIADYNALIVALKARIDTLQISQQLIDDLAGWAGGYSGKVLGPSQAKKMGMESFWVLLEVLGLGVALVENPVALAKMSHRYETREEIRRRTGSIRRPIAPAVRLAAVSAHMAEIGSRGGRGRSKCVAASSARHAALSRWSKARNGNGKGNGQRR